MHLLPKSLKLLSALLLTGLLAAAAFRERHAAAKFNRSGLAFAPDTAAGFDPGWLVFYRDSVAGHFSRGHRTDTLRACVIRRDRNEVLDSIPATADWIDDQLVLANLEAGTAVYGPRTDTLWLHYFVNCLLNLGDVDGDGLDDLAISDDVVDMSMLNSCQIYSRKSGGWKCILSFNAHESAFTLGEPGDSVRNMGRMVKVPCFLQRRHGHWYFQDFLVDDSLMDNNGNLPWHRIGPRFGQKVQYGF